MYDAFLNPYIPLQGYPGMQGGVGASGPVGAAVKLNFFIFSSVRSWLVCFLV